MCVINNVSNDLSSSLNSISQTFINDNISVMYYLIVAMMSQLDCCKQCVDKDKDFQIKQSIELQLQSMDSITRKEKFLDYLKATMKNGFDKDLIAWIKDFDDNVHLYQKQIDYGISKYREALKKLDRKFSNDIPEIKQQFESLEKQIKDLMNKSNHSTKDLETLQNDFKQLINIAQKQIEKSFLYKAIQWLNKQSNKASKDFKNHPAHGLDAIAIFLCKTLNGFLELFNQLSTDPIYKTAKTFGQKGESMTSVYLTVNKLANNFVISNLNMDEQKLQLNLEAKEKYYNAEKQMTDLSKVLEQALVNNNKV